MTIAVAAAIAATIIAVVSNGELQQSLILVLITAQIGAFIYLARQLKQTRYGLGSLKPLFEIAHDRDILTVHDQTASSLLKISQSPDPLYRKFALECLRQISDSVATIADGTIVFEGTETWRIAYEHLLRSPGLHHYRSVAWVRTANYWQDGAGQQSMQLNHELRSSGQLKIERIAILDDTLWPINYDLPVERVRQWIAEQFTAGIDIRLVRESALVSEPNLISDMGIYGSRAVGIQTLDSTCRTTRFSLSFDFEQVKAAEDIWQRLLVYSLPYSFILDQFTMEAS